MKQRQYTVQSSDGRTHVIEGPDDATDAEIIAATKSAFPPIASAPKEDTQAILAAQAAKYPTAAPETGKPLQPTEAPGIMDTISSYVKPVTNTAYDVGRGFAQSAAQTIHTLAKPIYAIPGIGPALAAGPSLEIPKDIIEPQNTAQRIGGGIERAAEFAAPGGAINSLAKSAKLGMMARAGMEGVSAFGVSKAHGDTNEDAVKNAIVSGGLSAAIPAVLKGVGKLGERVELTALRPYKSILEDVKNAEPGQQGKKLVSDIYKYDLGGSLEQSFGKAEAALDAREAALQAALKSQPGAQVNIYDAIRGAMKDLGQDASMAKNVGMNAAIKTQFKNFVSEIRQLDQTGATNGGAADLVMATKIKRGLSKLGSWMGGMGDPDAQAKEAMANAIYKQLNARITMAAGKAGPAIKQLNSEMGDIIPIQAALVNRIPVASRNNIVGLKEFIGLTSGAPGAKGLAMLDFVLKNPKAANALVQASKAAKFAPAIEQAGTGIASQFSVGGDDQ